MLLKSTIFNRSEIRYFFYIALLGIAKVSEFSWRISQITSLPFYDRDNSPPYIIAILLASEETSELALLLRTPNSASTLRPCTLSDNNRGSTHTRDFFAKHITASRATEAEADRWTIFAVSRSFLEWQLPDLCPPTPFYRGSTIPSRYGESSRARNTRRLSRAPAAASGFLMRQPMPISTHDCGRVPLVKAYLYDTNFNFKPANGPSYVAPFSVTKH